MGGETPITYLAWARYADDIGLTGSDRDLFHRFLIALDVEYLDWLEATHKAA